MATITRAIAKKLGTPIPTYQKPDYWLPHFLMIDSGGHK